MLSVINQTAVFKEKKPVFFKSTCIAGYILSGLFMLIGLIFIVIAGAPGAFSMFPGLIFYVSVAGGKISMGFALLSLILPMIAFFGVMQMWYQVKIGFYIFSSSLVMLSLLPLLMINLPMADLWLFVQPLLITSVIVIILFRLNFKNLH